MKNLLHPLAIHAPKSIDVFFGGTERETIDESAKLAFDTVKYVPKEQNVLYVNTLIDQEALENKMRRFASRRPRLHYVTWLEKSFMERLKTLEYYFKTQGIGTLVINSFDCAALTQRHRVELGQWLRRVRNVYKLRVIVFMQCKPGYYGVNGSLRFAASNLMEVGAYLKEHATEFGTRRLQEEEAIAKEFEKENSSDYDERVVDGVAVDTKAPASTEENAALTEKSEVEEVGDVEQIVERSDEDSELSPTDREPARDERSEEERYEEERYEEERSEDEDDDTPWVRYSSDEELEDLLDSFGGELSHPGAGWVIEEIELRQRNGKFPEERSRRIKEKHGVGLADGVSMESVEM